MGGEPFARRSNASAGAYRAWVQASNAAEIQKTARTSGGRWWQTPAMPILTDGVITMRRPGAQDIDALVAACQDPEIPRWTNVPSPYGRAEAQTYLTRGAGPARPGSSWPSTAMSSWARSACSNSTSRPRYGEIGYWVAAPARGRGLATRALRLLRDWAVGELGLERIDC